MSLIQSIAILTPLYVCTFWALVFLNMSMRKNRARYFLGFFMATALLLYLGHSMFFMGKYHLYIHYDAIYITTSLLVYPLYYQYIRLLTIDTRWSVQYLVHYIPALVLGLTTWLVNHEYILSSHNDAESYLRESNRIHLDVRSEFFLSNLVSTIHRVFFAVQVVAYYIMGYFLIKNYREKVQNYYSNQENRSMRWVAWIFISLLLTALLSSVFNVLGRFVFINRPEYLLIPSFLFSALIFTLGFLANLQDQVVREIAKEDQKENESLPARVPHINEDIDTKLLDLFRIEKLHLNPDLNIWDIASRLGTNRTYLSGHINKQHGVNFSMFVNRFRVEEAKEYLSGENRNRYSMEAIGEKCGFGSYNNFIRVFREFEKLTPGRYRDQEDNNLKEKAVP